MLYKPTNLNQFLEIYYMKVAVLFSGGKDSCRTVHFCLQEGHEVKYLVTMIPEREDSWLFHYPNIRLTELSAEAIGITHVTKGTSGRRDEEIKDLRKVLGILDVDAVACGGLFSEYQRNAFRRVCGGLGLRLLTPFWHVDPEEFLKETIDLGFEVMIVGVYAEGFDRSWLGRIIDLELIEELKELNEKFDVSLVGEGGEYETLVLDGPIFKSRLQITDSKIVWDEKTGSGYLHVKRARLLEKP